MNIIKTDTRHPDFVALIQQLDLELRTLCRYRE